MCSILHLELTGTSGTVFLKNEIRPQNLKLKKYRIEFASDANSASNSTVWVKLPFIGHSAINSNVQKNALPLMTSGSAITLQMSDICVSSHTNVQESFPYEISFSDSSTGFQKVSLTFEYNVAGIS